MIAKNMVQFNEINNILKNIETTSEQVKTALTNINNLINDTINSGVGIWDGASAETFKSKWNELAADIPTFITTFEKQGNNVRTLLEKTQAADEVTIN